MEDIFVGGTAGTSGKLLFQTTGGSFAERKQSVFEKDKQLEDNGVLFFDADNDGDMDLYVVSGGADFDKGSEISRIDYTEITAREYLQMLHQQCYLNF